MQSSELEMVIRLFLFAVLEFSIWPDIRIRFDVLSNIRYPVGCLARCRVSGRIFNSLSRMIFVPQTGIYSDLRHLVRFWAEYQARLDILYPAGY